MEDYYNWKAQYFDKTVIPQYKTDGTATKWDELDFGQIQYWILEPINKDYKRIILTLNGAKRPIFWRTNIRSAMNEGFHMIYYKFGWQDTIKGKNVKVINCVYPTGDIEQVMNNDEPQMLSYIIKVIQHNVKK